MWPASKSNVLPGFGVGPQAHPTRLDYFVSMMVWRPSSNTCGVQPFWYAWPFTSVDVWQLVQAAADAPCRVSSIWLIQVVLPAFSVVATASLCFGALLAEPFTWQASQSLANRG